MVKREFARLRADPGGETKALVRRAFWRFARRFTPALAVDRDGLRLFLSTDDDGIGRRLFAYPRVPESDIREAYEALRALPAVAARLDDGEILEIGGNIGSHTVEFLKNFGAARVTSIEPHPANCALLRQNATANAVADRVTILELALSDRDGTIELDVSSSNSDDHRISVGDRGEADATQTIPVRSASLDFLVASGEIDLDAIGLVWMDAQGHEAHILSGAEALLARDIPIVTEYWPQGLRHAGGLDRLHALLAEHFELVAEIEPSPGGPPRLMTIDELIALEGERTGRSGEGWLGTTLILSRKLSLAAG